MAGRARRARQQPDLWRVERRHPVAIRAAAALARGRRAVRLRIAGGDRPGAHNHTLCCSGGAPPNFPSMRCWPAMVASVPDRIPPAQRGQSSEYSVCACDRADRRDFPGPAAIHRHDTGAGRSWSNQRCRCVGARICASERTRDRRRLRFEVRRRRALPRLGRLSQPCPMGRAITATSPGRG